MTGPHHLPPWPVLRTIILFFFALAGIAWEIVAEQSDRPTLLILLAAMAGLPVFANVLDDRYYPKKDEKDGKAKDDDPSS